MSPGAAPATTGPLTRGKSLIDGASEVAETNDVLELYDRIFDEYLNGSDGDVKLDEWYEGLRKLGVDLTDIEKTHLWHVLNTDEADSLSRDQWSHFMTMRWESEELQIFQAAIESRINDIYTKHAFHEGDSGFFDAARATLMKRQMTKAIVSQAQQAQQEIRREEEWLEDLQRRGADPSFCVDTNALEWDTLEVAFWLQKLGLHMYMRSFKTRLIDGSILLRDVSENALYELGVEKFHMNKILREINVLRTACGMFYDVQHEVYKCSIASDYTLRDKCEALEKELEQTREEYESKLKDINEIRASLEREVVELQTQLTQSKESLDDMRRSGGVAYSISSASSMTSGGPTPQTSLHRGLTNEFWEDLAGEAERNDMFADVAQSLSWTPRQVVFWLKSINCGLYAASFLENDIDGQILVQDMTRDILSADLSVRTLHLAKLQREIHKLRVANNLQDWEICLCEVTRIAREPDRLNRVPSEVTEELENLRARVAELTDLNAQYNRQIGAHEAEITSLRSKLSEEMTKSQNMSKALEKQRRDEQSIRRRGSPQPPELEHKQGMEPFDHMSVEQLAYSRGISPGPPSESLMNGLNDDTASSLSGIHDPKTLRAIIKQSRGLIDKQSLIIQKQLNTLKSQRRTIEIQQETMVQQEELIARQKMKIHKYDKRLERRRHRQHSGRSSHGLSRESSQIPGASMGSTPSILSDTSSVSNTLNQLISRGLGLFSGDDTHQTTR